MHRTGRSGLLADCVAHRSGDRVVPRGSHHGLAAPLRWFVSLRPVVGRVERCAQLCHSACGERTRGPVKRLRLRPSKARRKMLSVSGAGNWRGHGPYRLVCVVCDVVSAWRVEMRLRLGCHGWHEQGSPLASRGHSFRDNLTPPREATCSLTHTAFANVH